MPTGVASPPFDSYAYLEASEGLPLDLQARVVGRRREAAREEADNIGAVLDEAPVHLDAAVVSRAARKRRRVYNSQFGRCHVGLADLLDEGGSEPYRRPQLLTVQLTNKKIGLERIIQALNRRTAAEIKAVDEVADASRP
jgi:hypothetical protein